MPVGFSTQAAADRRDVRQGPQAPSQVAAPLPVATWTAPAPIIGGNFKLRFAQSRLTKGQLQVTAGPSLELEVQVIKLHNARGGGGWET